MKLTRIALSVATTGLLALGPAAAALAAPGDGYRAPGITVVVTDLSPVVGETFFVIINGQPGEVIILTVSSPTASSGSITVAGSSAAKKTADASGAARFSVTLTEPGTYTLVATDATTGAVLATQVLTVPAATSVSTGGGTAVNTGTLAFTGADAVPVAVGAAALVAAGGGVVLIARRRRRAAAGADDED